MRGVVKAAIRETFSRRGFSIIALHFLAAFGFLSALVQFIAWAWNIQGGLIYPPMLAAGVIATALAWGILRAYPRSVLEYEFRRPTMILRIEIGDLLECKGDIAVGFSDTFDTDTANNVLINSESIQGQLLHRRYRGDRARLDRELRDALADVLYVREESPSDKRHGKRRRYPIGTVAALGDPGERVFAVAISELSNKLIARSGVDHLWTSLSRTWEAVRLHGQHASIAVPLMGTGLGRVSAINHENVLKLMILSVVSHARDRPICSEATVVIHPRDRDKISFHEIKAFLKSLD